MSRLLRKLRTVAHVALALAPAPLKRPIYRTVFGFKIAPRARIGCSVLDVDHLELEPGAVIGHGNLLTGTGTIRLERGAQIGYLNILRGGEAIQLGPYATVLRFNVINSIPDNDCEGPTDPRIELGPGAFVTSGHRLDFTDRIRLGKNVILAGRNSSLWTHNRQQSGPIEIGDFCYVGSEARLAPGAVIEGDAILGLGGVLVGRAERGKLHGGVPAKPIRDISDDEMKRLRRKTRRDIPDDLY